MNTIIKVDSNIECLRFYLKHGFIGRLTLTLPQAIAPLLPNVAAIDHKVAAPMRLSKTETSLCDQLLSIRVFPAGTSCVHMSRQVTQTSKCLGQATKTLHDLAASGANVATKGPTEHRLRLLFWLQMYQ